MVVEIPTNSREVATSNLQALSVGKIAGWLGFLLWTATKSNPVNPDIISTDASEFPPTDFGILKALEIGGHRL
jgi:hypothetical protein